MKKEWKMVAPIAVGTEIPDDYYFRFLAEAKEWKVTHILFTLLIEDSDAYWNDVICRIRKWRPVFEEKGIRTGIWIGHTIGHGGGRGEGEKGRFTRLIPDTLQPLDGCYCPMDQDFIRYYARWIAALAETGCEYIMIDDDYRLGTHGGTFGCFCDLHLEAFAEKYGKKVSAEELIQAIRTDLEVRNLWLDVNGKTLEDTLRVWGEAASAANPEIRMGIATAMTLYGSEGTTLENLLQAFNPGGNKPFFRTIGAPYWAGRPKDLIFVLEFNRLQLEKMKEFECWTEGDTWNRTLACTPSTYLGAYCDGMYLADAPGVQAYVTNYRDPRSYEPRYTTEMIDFTCRRKIFDSFRSSDAPFEGFEPIVPLNSIRKLDLDTVNGGWPDKPLAVSAFAEFGIPQTYNNPDAPVILVGNGIGVLSDEELRDLLKRPAFIDASAAGLLYRRGFDIGAKPFECRMELTASEFDPVSGGGSLKEIYEDGAAYGFSRQHFTPWELASSAGCVVSSLDDGTPVVLQTESAAGVRYVIVPFNLSLLAHENSTYPMWDHQFTWWNRLRAKQMRQCAEWLLGRPLVLQMDDFPPHLHILQRGNKVVLQNLSMEYIRLDEIKTAEPYKLINIQATNDNDRIGPLESVILTYQ